MINELIPLSTFCNVLNKHHRDFIIYFSTSITDYVLNKYFIENVEKNGGSIILKLTPFLNDVIQDPYSIGDLFTLCPKSNKNDKIILLINGEQYSFFEISFKAENLNNEKRLFFHCAKYENNATNI